LSTNAYTSAREFVAGLQSLSPTFGDKYQPVLAAILSTLNASPIMRAHSPLYVFVDSMVSDIELELRVIQTALAWQTKVIELDYDRI
jgi:hypothetical protein